MPNSACRSCIRFNTWACTETSSALTGSSATIRRGRVISARAIAMRWRCPPENSCGYLRRSLARRPTDVTASAARRCCSARAVSPCAASGSVTMRSMVWRGSSDPYGSWNTIWMSRRAWRNCSRGSACKSRPSSLTLPEVGWSSAITSRASVDLPEPDSPTIPMLRPASMVKLTPFSACTLCGGSNNRSRGIAYSRTRLSTCSSVAFIQLLSPSPSPPPPHPAGCSARDGPVPPEAAASRKRAAGRKVDQLRNAARDRGQLLALARKQAWTGREQAERVGMHAVREHGAGRAALHHAAAVHHQHPRDVLRDHAQVVRNQHQGHAALGHQVADEFENLLLDRHVQRRGGFVGNQQVGSARQGHGDRDALALAARELVRIGVDAARRLGNPDAIQQGDRFLARRSRRQPP